MAKQYISPRLPGARKRARKGQGIGAEKPEKASPETLRGLGNRVLKLLDSYNVPKVEAQISRKLSVEINGGMIVYLATRGKPPVQSFAVQTSDDEGGVSLYEWSTTSGAEVQRVTSDKQRERARLASWDIENIDVALQALETEGQQNG